MKDKFKRVQGRMRRQGVYDHVLALIWVYHKEMGGQSGRYDLISDSTE